MTVPIPASCAHRPTVGGLVAPFVNIRLADGGVDYRTPHQATYARCWTENLCQTWYALYVRTGGWQLTGNEVEVPCSDRGCLHKRVLVNGCTLTEPPRKVVLVSTPESGRVWRRLVADEVPAATS